MTLNRLALCLAPALLAACSSLPAGGLRDGRLLPCAAAPHCVSSLADDADHRVAPLTLAAPGPVAWDHVVATVAGSPRTTLAQRQDRYAHAEVVSPWHFYTDDLELLWDGAARVDVRSSSRIGYYDFHVNRDRVEALRAKLQAEGVAAR